MSNALRVLFIVSNLLSASDGLTQSKREYKLNFNYDPFSAKGPRNWADIKAGEKNHQNWADFFKFMSDRKSSLNDLDMDRNECNSDNNRPSPVHLVPNMPCIDNHEILTKKIKRRDCLFSDMTFEIAPNTLRASMPYNDYQCTRPSIDMSGGMPNDWLFTWLEVHLRSEHVVDGRRFDGEINMIHIGTEEQNRELAILSILLESRAPRDEPRFQRFLDKWQAIADKVRDNLANLNQADNNRRRRDQEQEHIRSTATMLNEYHAAAQSMIHQGRFHPRSSYLGLDFDAQAVDTEANNTQNLHKAEDSHQGNVHKEITESQDRQNSYQRNLQQNSTNPVGSIRKKFPYDLWPSIYYYRYQGSMTYPPCSKNVQWRIFDIPMRISRRQYKQLARLLESYVDESTGKSASVLSSNGENMSPLYPINSKKQNVTHCTYKQYRHWRHVWANQ